MFRHVATAITTALARFGQWLANDWVMEDPYDDAAAKRYFVMARQQGKTDAVRRGAFSEGWDGLKPVVREGVPLHPDTANFWPKPGSPFPPKPVDVIGEDELRAELDRLLGPEQARNALKPRKVAWPPSRDMLEGGGPAVSQERCPCCGGPLDPAVHVSQRGR